MASPWGSTISAPAEIAPSPVEPTTRFKRARQVVYTRLGALTRAVLVRERVILVLVLVIVVLAVSLSKAALSVKVLPYIVEVAETGQVRTVGILPRPWDGESLPPIQFAVQEWIEWIRGVPESMPLLARNWQKASAFMSNTTRQRMQPFADEQMRRHKAGEIIEVEFASILAIAGTPSSYAVEWREREISITGQVRRVTPWKATMRIDVLPDDMRKVMDEETSQRLRAQNPLGLFLSDIHWGPKAGETK